MLYLAIESSCDETSLALLSGNPGPGISFFEHLNSFEVVSSVVSSQIKTHAKFGGVVPEIGARLHANQIHFLFQMLLQNIGSDTPLITTDSFEKIIQKPFDIKMYSNVLSTIDEIFVTTEPGLTSALKVGMEFAKTLQFFVERTRGNHIKITEINHLNGHVYSSFFQKDKQDQHLSLHMIPGNNDVFPHLHLLVSGGNSQFILMKSSTEMDILGQTLDDAAGECLDKIGRMLGFPYPAGVCVARTAGLMEKNLCDLPIGMKHNQTVAVSFSGLKTACRLRLEKLGFELEKPLSSDEIDLLTSGNENNLSPRLMFIKEFAISAQSVLVAQLINKLKIAIKIHQPHSLGISGGVSANLLLRKRIGELGIQSIFIPPLFLTGDNAVMIGLAGVAQKYSTKTPF
jgi:N6-L-threonylcarbamoyladenine synthase